MSEQKCIVEDCLRNATHEYWCSEHAPDEHECEGWCTDAWGLRRRRDERRGVLGPASASAIGERTREDDTERAFEHMIAEQRRLHAALASARSTPIGEPERRDWRRKIAIALMREVDREHELSRQAAAHAEELDALRASLKLTARALHEELARRPELEAAAGKARDALRAMRANARAPWSELSGLSRALRALEEVLP